jgi:hypothetical protein
LEILHYQFTVQNSHSQEKFFFIARQVYEEAKKALIDAALNPEQG